MADVFICYAEGDAAAARRLGEAVSRLGYSVRWDEALPAAGEIEMARAAIVVWSQAAAASRSLRAEADLACNQGKLVQVSTDGRLPPMPFNQLQCAALDDWRGEDDHHGWEKVKASLAALAGPCEAVAPAPPGPHRWHKLLIAVIALSFLVIAGAMLFAWLPR